MMNEPEKKEKGDPFLIAFGIYGAVGFQLAATVVGGLMAGAWIDKKVGLHLPWFTIGGIVIGSIGGFYNLIRILNWKQARKGK